MQEDYTDDSVGEVHTADTLEELLPLIKKSLANPQVKYVKIFNARNGKVQANEQYENLLDELKEG